MLYFVNGLNFSLTANLGAYITSDFSEHSLLTVISIVTSVMGAGKLKDTPFEPISSFTKFDAIQHA